MDFASQPNGLIWITGLSGAGKTTFAAALRKKMIDQWRCCPVMLDGDVLRRAMNQENSYAAESRKKLAGHYKDFAAEFVFQGHCVICATISMFQDIRDTNRALNKNYCEVFIDVDDVTRSARKPNGSLTTNEIKHDNSIYQLPQNPDFIFSNLPAAEIDAACDQVVSFIKNKWVFA